MRDRVISGTTKLCGLIGDPVEHTMSPAMHNAAFRDAGLDYLYVAFRVKKEELGKAIAGMRALNIKGLNVTIPHKVAVLPFLDKVDNLAEKIGAVNRFRMREDFLNISVSFKRVMNILDEKFETGADESLLKEEAEEKLYRDYLAVKERSLPFIAALKYFEALTELAALKPSVDYFFDKVLVNAKDPNLRKNRKILLSLIGNLFLEVFDFSKIIDK